MGPDGKVWLKTSVDTYGAHLLDPLTGEITSFPLSVSFYGTASNSKGDLYLASLSDGVIGEVIAKTGKTAIYPTPTPRSGSRRGHIDQEDRFWFAEFFSHKIGMFDTTTKKFREWPIPVPWAGPYDAIHDGNGYVWSGGMHTDLIYRLNPDNGEVDTISVAHRLTQYPPYRRGQLDRSGERLGRSQSPGQDHPVGPIGMSQFDGPENNSRLRSLAATPPASQICGIG